MRRFIIIFLLSLMITNTAYSNSSLPINQEYMTTIPVEYGKYKDSFWILHKNRIVYDTTYLIKAGDQEKVVTLTEEENFKVVELGDFKEVYVYRKDKERMEISSEVRKNMKDYAITKDGRSFYFFRYYNKQLDGDRKPKISKEMNLSDKVIDEIKHIFEIEDEVEKNTEKIIAKIELLKNDNSIVTMRIIKSPYADNKQQIKDTIKNIYENNGSITEILTLDNISLRETEYSMFSGRIFKNIKSNSKYLESNYNLRSVSKSQQDYKVKSSNYKVHIHNNEHTIKTIKKHNEILLPINIINKDYEINKNFRRKDLQIITLKNSDSIVEIKMSSKKIYIDGVKSYLKTEPIKNENISYISTELLKKLGYDVNINGDVIKIENIKVKGRGA